MVHYKKEPVVIFDVPTEKIFAYMKEGEHKHAAFKSHRLVGVSGNDVTIESEIYNPDGTANKVTITHNLNPPQGITTTMSGGPFDGAKFRHKYTPIGNTTRVDLEGDFPAFPGMNEADELKMIDGFFTAVFAEDKATLLRRK